MPMPLPTRSVLIECRAALKAAQRGDWWAAEYHRRAAVDLAGYLGWRRGPMLRAMMHNASLRGRRQ